MSLFVPNKKKSSASLRPSTAPTPTSSSSSQTPTPTSPQFHLSSSLNSNPHVRLQLQLPATQPVPSRFKTLSHSASSSSLNSIANTSSVPILQWTLTDVSTFLSTVKCGHLASAFESNDITGEVILELDASHLKEMGIDRVGDRVRMLSALKGLKKTAAAESAGSRQSSMRGPKVVVTGGEDELDGLGMSYSIGRGGENGLYRPNGNGMLSHPPVTIFATPPPSSVETFANSNEDTPRGRALSNRPAPLDISSAQPAADPRLPQAYQPEPSRHESSPHSSPSHYKISSSSSSIRSARTPRAPSPHPPPPSGPPPSGPLPPVRAPSPSNAVTPTVSAHSSRAAREASLRPPGGHAPSASLSLNTTRRPTATTGMPTSYSSSSLSTSSGVPFPAFGTSSPMSGRPSTGTTGGSFTERRALLAKEREARAGSSGRPSTSQGLSSPVGSTSTAPRSLNTNLSASQGASPALGVNGRPVQGQTSSHPFATATPGTPSSPSYPPLSSSIPINNPGQTASASPFSSTPNPPPSAVGSSAFAAGRSPYQNSANSSSTHQLSLDELRRKTIKFINAEDGHSRVVNLTDCQGGLEVMEVVLRKFGKWNGGGFEIETESEDDLDGKSPKRGLCVDGWGVFIDGYGEGGASVPLTEAELLSICHAPPDSPSRERGLILKRTRKLPNRKHIEDFFGETPPAPNSPTSPTYYAGPRLGANDDAGDLHSMLHPPSTPLSGLRDSRNGSNVGAKKMNRASTVSVMSGLGVPAPSFVESYMSRDSFSSGRSPYLSAGPGESAHSPPTQSDSTTQTNRSPSAGSFLVNRGRKMYNFFGHRPPSELISNHLAEYFPSAKKKVLERTARNSMMRLGSGASGVGESASLNMLQAGNGSGGLPGTSWSDERLNPSSRLSMSSMSGVGSPRKKRNSSIGGRKSSESGKRNGHQNSTLRAMSPPRTAIPEDPNGERTASIEVPRLSFSTDGGETLAYLDQPSSPQPNDFTDDKPPLLPPFASSTESLLDSFKEYSPESSSTTLDAPAPQLGAGGRRGSNASNSRLSMISQIRRSKDRSDTASMLTVDEITAHVESKRTSMIGGESDDGTEEFDELRNLALGARRPSRTETIRTFGAVGAGKQESQDGDDEDEEDDGTEDGEEYESEEESDEEDYSEEEESEDDDEEDEEEEVVETAEDEHGKAFMSTGGKRSIKWIKGALIGSGSFGSVFLGMDAQNGLLMAVKQVEIPTGVSVNEERKKSMLSALEREIELLKELQHENIVQYLDSSTDAAHLNIFLEYVPGGSVSALLGNYGAFEEALVRTFVRQTLQGLAYLHDREIIHRDIKGANILVDNKGGIKISDFGISKKVESNLLATTHQRQSLQGTVFWMAPEVVRQTAHTRQADIWSVGCLVIEMLTGQRPWGALDQMQVMFRIGSSGKPDFPPDITTDAEDFLNKTLELDHIKRPSAAECLSHPFIIQNLAPTL